MFSDSSHISHDGAKRLQAVFSILNKYHLDLSFGEVNNYTKYFGFKGEGKSTWWHLKQYSRHLMNDPIETKRYLMNKRNSDAPGAVGNNEFNALFVNCEIEINKYFKKREHWYGNNILKDKVIFIDKIRDLVKYYLSLENQEKKINNLLLLIKSLHSICNERIWIEKIQGNTSMNQVLKKISEELSYGVMKIIRDFKTPSTGEKIRKISNDIDSFIEMLKSSIHNRFEGSEKISEFFNDISSYSYTPEVLDRVEIYKISKENYYKEIGMDKKTSNSHSTVYFKIKLLKDTQDVKSYFLKCNISELIAKKNFENMERGEKDQLLYYSKMLFHYTLSKLCYLPRANYLISVSDSAFNQSVEFQECTSSSSSTLFRRECVSSADNLVCAMYRKPSDNEAMNTKKSTVFKCLKSRANGMLYKLDNMIHPKKFLNQKIPEVIPSLPKPMLLNITERQTKNKQNLIHNSLLEEIRFSDCVVVMNNKGEYDDCYREENKKINIILSFQEWGESLSNYNTLYINASKIKNSQELLINQKISRNIGSLQSLIDSFVETMANDRLKALARYTFQDIDDSPTSKEKYFKWIVFCDESNLIKKIWDSLCDSVLYNSRVKFEIKSDIALKLKSL